jgi:tetratricopeptide (TPR) repeat protein
VPTGLYANTWFDGYGTFVLPPIGWSKATRRAGQILMTLGMVPTLLIALGVWTAIGDLRRKGWDDTRVTMLLASASMAGIVVLGTRSVPTQAAVKATYLMPVSVAFGFWFGLGIDKLRRSWPSLVRPVAVLCTLLGLVSIGVFTHGMLIDDGWMMRGGGASAFRNLHGMVYFAAGDEARARGLFESAARANWPLAIENLAALELQDGRPETALSQLDRANEIIERRHAGAGVHERRYLQATLAEYANSRAVILQQLGRNEEALAAAEEARRLDPSIPETSYNVGVLKLIQADAQSEGRRRARLVRQARRAFEASFAADPAFYDALAMAGVANTLAGRCDAGAAMIRRALAPHPGEFRAYPIETGPGDQNAAALLRRRRIERLPAALDPATRLNACLEARA